MKVKYTNTITTARHPRFGPVRIIHINLEPWICLEDLARVAGSSSAALSSILKEQPQLAHASDCSFVHLTATSLPKPIRRLPALRWIKSILSCSGLTGPSSKTKARKSTRKKTDLTISLKVLHRYCDDTMSYEEWKEDLRNQVVEAGVNVASITSAIRKDRIPQDDARITMICQATVSAPDRALWVVLHEAREGWHTQDSLEQAVNLAVALEPDSSNTVDVAAFHEFFQIADPLNLWLNEQIYWQKLKPGKDYFIEGGLRFLPRNQGANGETVRARLSMAFAEMIISRIQTPRGDSMREMIQLQKECEAAEAECCTEA